MSDKVLALRNAVRNLLLRLLGFLTQVPYFSVIEAGHT
jgi:hypothetical protein